MQALSPLDGRYRAKVEALATYFSEEALNKSRLEVEIRYFMQLSDLLPNSDFPKLSMPQKKILCNLIHNFDDKDAAAIKTIEKTTNHDVKAVEYFLKKKVAKIKGLKKYTEFIHFGLTSEDVNNLSYGLMISRALKDVMIPATTSTIADLKKIAANNKSIKLLSLTHGQPATPTTLGKEMMVFVDRLNRQLDQLKKFTMSGKFGSAVGNYSAQKAAYPKIKWEAFGAKFMKSLGLDPLANTTQINPHDDLAQLSHIEFRINTIGIDLSRDIWHYISRGVFGQKLIKGEVGSSTMPHKVNPIDFENAEGNFGLSSALFSHFAEKLPISRLQRDLSDSTVQRSIGTAFGYNLLALASLRKGLSKLSVNKKVIQQELDAHPELLAEAIQTVLRKNGVSNAYEKLKAVTRGESVSIEDMKNFIEKLKIPEEDKKTLRKLC
ncbi:MAG: adenylosuccinate lyase [Candidatus Peribacter sp.]|nr:adenylosuccinate lyase [Candidatus Peribacter sp.]MBT4601085.1 adenylosuccinate lyase [Candidatus Peribacter sp.]MBT5937231.1 adenylosuccinate lyase [Candidatus Peribacter sp.]MBT7762107.1 adenylosuccinate lyase [Candidatus Peribacter sp.]